MKKHFFLILLLSGLLLPSCFIKKDPLLEIRRIARSSDLKKKEEAAELYQQVIDTMVEAYISMGSLNKAIGEKLMMQRYYEKAIEHLEMAREIRTDDANIYFWLGVCYVNLYKNGNDKSNLIKAENNYETAIKLLPGYMDALYSYAQLLFYAKEDYEKSVEILNEYLYGLSPKTKELKEAMEKRGEDTSNFVNPKINNPDIKAYFLLGRAYYMLENYKEAYNTYQKIYSYKNKLTNEEKSKLDEFILETSRLISGE